eukprot:TRINITY_DN30709_c0_g1_i1.p1 TRINITY_DN30709_c0_g1~~TRINITY_DN30709_c0_g1_i1.p1  ORF type:complete len:339 (-),score=63.84 TRINITY_DN30709_c0_g1_i1:175-1113(-)
MATSDVTFACLLGLGGNPIVPLLAKSLDASDIASLQAASTLRGGWDEAWLIWAMQAIRHFRVSFEPAAEDRARVVRMAACLRRLPVSVPSAVVEIRSLEHAESMMAAAQRARATALKSERTAAVTASCLLWSNKGEAQDCGITKGICPRDPVLVPISYQGEDCHILLDFAFDRAGSIYMCAELCNEVVFEQTSSDSEDSGGEDLPPCCGVTKLQRDGSDGFCSKPPAFAVDVRAVSEDAKVMICGVLLADGEWRPVCGITNVFNVPKAANLQLPVVICAHLVSLNGTKAVKLPSAEASISMLSALALEHRGY